MPSMMAILLVAVLIMTLVHAVRPNWVPLWIPVLLLTIVVGSKYLPIT
jgi:hypothetical protein